AIDPHKRRTPSLGHNRLAWNACKARTRSHSSPWPGLLRWLSGARSRAVEQEFAFACVARERCGARELRLRLGEATQVEEEVAADTGQEVVGLKRSEERRVGKEGSGVWMAGQ